MSCAEPLHTSLSADGTRQVTLAGTGEPIEHDRLVLFNKAAVSERKNHISVQPALFISLCIDEQYVHLSVLYAACSDPDLEL